VRIAHATAIVKVHRDRRSASRSVRIAHGPIAANWLVRAAHATAFVTVLRDPASAHGARNANEGRNVLRCGVLPRDPRRNDFLHIRPVQHAA
jgi:hypothetical protein